MLGGGPYYCETCPKCRENDMWNGRCASCGHEQPEDGADEDDVGGSIDRLINSLEAVNVDKLRYEDIKIVFATHGEDRSVYEEHEGKRRLVKFDYRKGFLTPIGDIDRDVWTQIAETLIMRSFEGWITDSLHEWYIAHPTSSIGGDISWHLALKSHIHRDFDRPGWLYYIAWNRMYRPAELDGKLFPTVSAPCCDIPGETTVERLRMERRELYGYCPYCFTRSKLKLISDPCNSRRKLMVEESEEAA